MKNFKDFVAEASKTRKPTRDFLRKHPKKQEGDAQPVKKQDTKAFDNIMGNPMGSAFLKNIKQKK